MRDALVVFRPDHRNRSPLVDWLNMRIHVAEVNVAKSRDANVNGFSRGHWEGQADAFREVLVHVLGEGA